MQRAIVDAQNDVHCLRVLSAHVNCHNFSPSAFVDMSLETLCYEFAATALDESN